MSKVLSPTVHGVLDYVLGLAFLLAPGLFDFSEEAALVSRVIGVALLGASIVTRYPFGLIKVLPFPVHGVIETIMAAAWIVFPWVFGFADDAAARNFFIVAGIGLLVVAALTDYRADEYLYSRTEGRGFAGSERRSLGERRRQAVSVPQDRRLGQDRRLYA